MWATDFYSDKIFFSEHSFSILQFNRRCLSGKLVVSDHYISSSSSRLLLLFAVTAETLMPSLPTCLWNTKTPARAGMLSLGLFVLNSFHPSVLVGFISIATTVWLSSPSRKENCTWIAWITPEKANSYGSDLYSFWICTWRSSSACVHCWCSTSRRCLGFSF